MSKREIMLVSDNTHFDLDVDDCPFRNIGESKALELLNSRPCVLIEGTAI